MSIKLGEICNFQSGGTPSKNNSEFFDGTIPWVTTTSLNGSKIDERNAVTWITEKSIKESAAKIVPANSIMVGTRVGVGKVAINTVEMSTSQDIISLLDIDEERWDKDYLCKFLQSKSAYLNSQARGATIKGIKINVLADLEVPDISFKEQCYISKVLNIVAELMNARQQQLAKLDELVKARFVEIFGDLAAPDCLWLSVRLMDTCENQDAIKCGPFGTQLSKEEYKSDGVAVWEIPQINSQFVSSPTHYLTEEKAKQLQSYSICPGDIAMSRKGNVGKCAVFPKEFEPGIIHSDVLRIRVDQKRVLPVFMMCQLHFSKAVQHQIKLVSSGAIMAGINVTKLKKIYVHIPPMDLQRRFVAFVESVDKTKLSIQNGLEQMEILKKALMQKYFG